MELFEGGMNVLQDPLGVPVVLFTDPSGDLLGRMRSVAKPPDKGGRGVEGVHDGIGRVVQDRLLLQRPVEHVGTSGRAPSPPFAFHQSGPSKHTGGTGGRARRGALSHHHHHSRRDMMLMPFPSASARTGRGGLRLPDVDRHALDDRDDVGQKDHARAFEERPSRGAGGTSARLPVTHRKTPASRTHTEGDSAEPPSGCRCLVTDIFPAAVMMDGRHLVMVSPVVITLGLPDADDRGLDDRNDVGQKNQPPSLEKLPSRARCAHIVAPVQSPLRSSQGHPEVAGPSFPGNAGEKMQG